MSTTYSDLVQLGVIKHFKADIIVEAARDLYYLSHIRKNFTEQRGINDHKEATNGTVKIVIELINQNYCNLATWGKEQGNIEQIKMTDDELYNAIYEYEMTKTFPFDFFLIVTEKGKEWVARYKSLINEL